MRLKYEKIRKIRIITSRSFLHAFKTAKLFNWLICLLPLIIDFLQKIPTISRLLPFYFKQNSAIKYTGCQQLAIRSPYPSLTICNLIPIHLWHNSVRSPIKSWKISKLGHDFDDEIDMDSASCPKLWWIMWRHFLSLRQTSILKDYSLSQSSFPF